MWVLHETACVTVSPFDVSVGRIGSMTSNDVMRGKVYCRCVRRRFIDFETEIYYLDLRTDGRGKNK